VRLLEGIGAAWLAWRRSPTLSHSAEELAHEPSLEEMSAMLRARRFRVVRQGIHCTLTAFRWAMRAASPFTWARCWY